MCRNKNIIIISILIIVSDKQPAVDDNHKAYNRAKRKRIIRTEDNMNEQAP